MTHREHRHARRTAILSIVAAALCATLASSSHAGSLASHLTLIHTRHALALPAVTLPPGSYTFEILNPNTSGDVVVVRSDDQRKVYFVGFTRRIERPRNTPREQVLSLGEAPAGEPAPIRAWYPAGSSIGREFLY